MVRSATSVRGRRFIAVAVAAAGVLGFSLPSALGADAPGSLRAQAETLRARNATLADRRHSALLELYALESRLAAAESRLARLRSRLDDVRAERASAKARLRIARETAAYAQGQLAEQVRALYQQGEPDALAILLGAGSIDEALTGLEGLQRAARQTERIIAQARRARGRTLTLSRTLARRAAELQRVTAAAADTADALAAALADRRAYLQGLAAQQALNAEQITALESEAIAAQRRSQQITAAPPALAAPAAPTLQPAGGGRTLTVESTGYALPGTTASGLPVGWGIVAVDPSVIPMGTKMTIPGYGEGVAADTGSAVQGLIIDLWFPTTAMALEWGRRTVTITLH